MTKAFDLDRRTALIAVVLLWAIWSVVTIISSWHAIVPMTFTDPDDAMRLVQVRDWMAGQSWFDVIQYRSEPPHGAPMHWSRFVDIPIMLMIRLAGLVLPAAGAERFAVVVVPLLLLLALAVVLHHLTFRATGRRITGVAAVLMLMLSLGVLVQFKPLRIDHHGTQILLGVISVAALLRAVTGRVRHAAIAGLASALSLSVAIEGLPLVAAIGGALGFVHLRDARGGRLLLAYLAALTFGAFLLPLITLGVPAMLVPWCDALSPAYQAPFAVATGVLAIALRLIPQNGMPMRLATLALAGGAAAATFRLGAPVCAAGPFASLDPLVARIWYRNIAEGLPVWVQPLDLRFLLPLPSLLGLAATALAIRLDAPARREGWIALLIVQVISCAVSILVMRAMGLAHLLALPATAWLVLRALAAAQSLKTAPRRVITSVACFLLTPIGAEAAVIAALPETNSSKAAAADNAVGARSICVARDNLRGLDALPKSELFAPLDISAHLLAYTQHSVVATGHHRAREGMKTVISAFIARPETARAIMMDTPSRYVVLCKGENEVQKYAKLYPASLTAALMKNRPPAWLQPVAMRPGESIHVWRIVRADQPATKRIATPFMQ